MRNIKQVAELTGVSVRTLQYYDEIGLFSPSRVNESGHRQYDDAALGVLQQILFFRELDFSLKDIMLVMRNPQFDRRKAFEKQRELIRTKRDRLDNLLLLLEKLVSGEQAVSFEEFDMSAYFRVLDDFKDTHTNEIIERWESVANYDEMVGFLKSGEPEIAQMAIQQYGSVQLFAEAVRGNLNHMENMDTIKENADAYIAQTDAITKRLTANLTNDPSSPEIQAIAGELILFCNQASGGLDMGENHWGFMADNYLTNPVYIETTNRKYGEGAAEFIGKALKAYLAYCPKG